MHPLTALTCAKVSAKAVAVVGAVAAALALDGAERAVRPSRTTTRPRRGRPRVRHSRRRGSRVLATASTTTVRWTGVRLLPPLWWTARCRVHRRRQLSRRPPHRRPPRQSLLPPRRRDQPTAEWQAKSGTCSPALAIALARRPRECTNQHHAPRHLSLVTARHRRLTTSARAASTRPWQRLMA